MASKNELVRFKGIGDGVKINIDAEADIYEIIYILENKIKENKAFFGDGNCRIKFDGRDFSSGERSRLTELLKRLLPLSKVSFVSDEPKAAPPNDWIVEYKEKGNGVHPAERVTEHSEEKPARMVPEKEFYSVFRSNRARMYEGFVKAGMTIRSDGHLILLGSVEEGAELIAVGNILVIGGLYGRAHAGCNGHNGSYILAMDMHPELIKISDYRKEFVYEEAPPEPEQPKEEVKRSFFGKLKREKEPEEVTAAPEKTEFSAVALVKNNKIVVDNFTIQTFTNPKNMI